MTSPQAIIKDPQHPGFPHGTTKGYTRGCTGDKCPASPTCREMKLRARKRMRARQSGVIAPTDWDMTSATPVREHIQRLLEIPDVNCHTIAKITGVDPSAISHIAQGKARGAKAKVRVGTARKILAVTEEQVRAQIPDRVTDLRKTVQLLKSMQAQGFSMERQSKRMGRPSWWASQVVWGPASRGIPREHADAVRALAEKLDMARGPDRSAAGRARTEGWHPLVCYDDDGNLIPEAVRDEKMEAKKEQRTRLARQRLTILRHSLIDGWSGSRIGEDLGIDAKVCDNIRREAGLRFAPGTATNVGTIAPESMERAAEIRRILIEHAAACADPWETVRFELGMMLNDRYNWDTPAPPTPAESEEAEDVAEGMPMAA